MADYKETNIAGKSWQRTGRVVIENPLNGTPSILFVEEEAMQVGTGILTRPVANLSASFDANDALHMAIYTKLNELYVLLRTARDKNLTA